jgi:hypothetical protein
MTDRNTDFNPFRTEGPFVVTRGMARNMQIYGPFPDNIAALKWAHEKWGDSAYMIKMIRTPS